MRFAEDAKCKGNRFNARGTKCHAGHFTHHCTYPALAIWHYTQASLLLLLSTCDLALSNTGGLLDDELDEIEWICAAGDGTGGL